MIGMALLWLVMALSSTLPSGSNRALRSITSGPPTRQELGNAGWLILHKMAAIYKEEPTQKEQLQLDRFIHDWGDLYPCDECANHFRAMLEAFPPDVRTREAFMLWLCEAHNRVNVRLGYREFQCSVESLEARWGGCGCKEKAEPGD